MLDLDGLALDASDCRVGWIDVSLVDLQDPFAECTRRDVELGSGRRGVSGRRGLERYLVRAWSRIDVDAKERLPSGGIQAKRGEVATERARTHGLNRLRRRRREHHNLSLPNRTGIGCELDRVLCERACPEACHGSRQEDCAPHTLIVRPLRRRTLRLPACVNGPPWRLLATVHASERDFLWLHIENHRVPRQATPGAAHPLGQCDCVGGDARPCSSEKSLCGWPGRGNAFEKCCKHGV